MTATPEAITAVLAKAGFEALIHFGPGHSQGFQVTSADGTGSIEVHWWPSSQGHRAEGAQREDMLGKYARAIREAGYTVDAASAGWLVVTAKEGTS